MEKYSNASASGNITCIPNLCLSKVTLPSCTARDLSCSSRIGIRAQECDELKPLLAKTARCKSGNAVGSRVLIIGRAGAEPFEASLSPRIYILSSAELNGMTGIFATGELSAIKAQQMLNKFSNLKEVLDRSGMSGQRGL